MTKNYTHTGRRVARWMRALLPLLGASLALSACNSKEDPAGSNQYVYVEDSNASITAFKIKADNKILRGLDTVYFSIDLDRGLIYNADSLPKGTRITDLIPVITYPTSVSGATIEMTGGTKRDGQIDYKEHPNDSVDFTGRVKLTLTTYAGTTKAYDLKVNVHTTEPDTLCWGETAVSKLPSRLENPKVQRTVKWGEKVVTLIQENNDTYTFASTTDPGAQKWEKSPVTFGFTPDVRSMTACGDLLYMRASDDMVYASQNGTTWMTMHQPMHSILGEYDGQVLGIRRNPDGAYYITTLGATNGYYDGPTPEGFPVEGFTNMYSYKSIWMASPICVLAGGVTADGRVSSAVWAFDGNNWAKLSEGKIPAVQGATLVPYHSYLRTGSSWNYDEYSTLFLIGGLKGDGTFPGQTYISYDNGVNWSLAPAMLQMPGYIPGMWQLDSTVDYEPMSAPLLPNWQQMADRQIPGWYRIATEVEDDVIHWECPYIYLYGGTNQDGVLYNTIWRGVINRLAFTPII